MNNLTWKIKESLRTITPAPLLGFYHLFIAILGAVLCGFPSTKLVVIAGHRHQGQIINGRNDQRDI